MKTKSAAEVLPFLPIAVRNRVEELVFSLKKTLDRDLSALLLHGSVVRGHYIEGSSDVDLLIVVHNDAPARLEQIGPALRLARASAGIECMILREDEIARSADVFPLLYHDIQNCHALLHGSDPFADLVIHDEHRRLRVEQELRDARIRLRRLAAEDGLAGPALGAPLLLKVRRLRSPLAALLSLQGKSAPDDLDHVLQGCASLLGVDVAPLHTPGRDPHAALLALHQLLDKAVAHVDALEVAR